ncbi:uncharacterized protein [Coffea arabica]|uniref:Reverse transcriptase/retrotransposon-derived protein RNase H-like domain-containing protein n=1 Tax=Coffea arabica TaxID=13443 RepID=A0ABM4UFE6_COFAR
MDHCMDTCPFLQEDGTEQVNMARDVPVPRKQYDLYSNTYNPARNQILGHEHYSVQQDTRTSMTDMETRMSQIATAINRMESHFYGKLPSQPEANPKNETFELDREDTLEVTLAKHLELGETLSVKISDELYRAIEALHLLPLIFSRFEIPSVFVPETQMKLLPSIVQAPELEFKPLPKHLKYAFLGDKETLPAIRWSTPDIKGISPSLCMHRIWLEDDAKLVRQAQRRLNPLMMEVVKKEIHKLLEVGTIFPILDSPWVSPVQIVPKKAGVTVEENQEGFYRRFIKDFSNIGAPLFKLLQKDVAFDFTNECKVAFDKLKESLTPPSVIQQPDWSLPFKIMCDASDYAVEAVSEERIGRAAHAIYYASKALNGA